jgi:hypothetical protein
MDDEFDDRLWADFTENGQPGVASPFLPPKQGLPPLVDGPGVPDIPELAITDPPPPPAAGPANPDINQTLASFALEADDLPNPIDPTLLADKVYLIFKPFGPKKLEFSLYTSDGTQYNRHDPVVDGVLTRVPPGLIMTQNLEAETVYGVARYLKMFGLALEDKHAVPTPKETPQKPFAVKITNVNREVYDRLTLARFCGLQISKPLYWDRPDRKHKDMFELFHANIGFVEWAMLPYNQTKDIKTLLALWRQKSPSPVPFILAQPNRNQAFVFDITQSELEPAYGFADVELVTTIVPVAGRSKRRRKDNGPAAPLGDGGPAAQRKDKGVSFTVDREPVAAPAPPPPPQGDQTDSHFLDELLQQIDAGSYDGLGPGS